LCDQDEWGESSIFWIKRQYLRLAYIEFLLSSYPGRQEHDDENIKNNLRAALALPGTRGKMKLINREIVGKLVSVPLRK
jgi:hypothetical protein